MRIRVLAMVVAGFALLPAAASAADRYASPSGTSNLACGQADPCDIVTAVSDAANGDTVIIEPGTYTPTMTLDDNGFTLDIQGQAGSLPVINSTASYGFELMGATTLSNVEVIDNTNSGYAVDSIGHGSTISHVIAESSGPNAVACLAGGLMIDSLCWASGLNAAAAVATSLVPSSVEMNFDNDTLIASGSNANAQPEQHDRSRYSYGHPRAGGFRHDGDGHGLPLELR
jgi:hypothetical protein